MIYGRLRDVGAVTLVKRNEYINEFSFKIPSAN